MKLIVAAILLAVSFQPVAAAVTNLVEIGENDFQINRLSESGAGKPAVAYNTTDNEYLVVWPATAYRSQNFCPLFPLVSVREIWGQRLDAASGNPVGEPVRISTTCNPDLRVETPDVVYNPNDNGYLVVWLGELDIIESTRGENEVFGQLLNASLVQVGSDDFRISDMGGSGDNTFDARDPVVTHNSTGNEYLVVWSGDDNEGGLSDDEDEIFGQLLNDNGGELGANDFRISDMGDTGDFTFAGRWPGVTYNPMENEYLVVWFGDDDEAGLVNGEFEIFGQRLNDNGGEEGANDFRISDMGGIGEYNGFSALAPAVSYNSVDNEYLVVWVGSDDTVGPFYDEYEIFGQRLDENGAGVGVNDFRISDMGDSGNNNYHVGIPDVTHNPETKDYLVVWDGADNQGDLVPGEYEIFGQRLDRNGTELGANDFRISEMGGTGTHLYSANYPALACDTLDNEYLVVWRGDEGNGRLDDERYIFGQRLGVLLDSIFDDGFE